MNSTWTRAPQFFQWTELEHFDLVSRNAMLQGLMGMDGGDRILPFVRMFYGEPSTFLWEDDLGGVHHILQGEGGNKAIPSCPCCLRL